MKTNFTIRRAGGFLAYVALAWAAAAQMRYVVSDLGTLGGENGTARAINASGQVVGVAQTAESLDRAFLYSGGVMIDLGTHGGTNSGAYDINDSGAIVGVAETKSGFSHAFLFSAGSMKDLGTLGGPTSFAYGISNTGEITGFAEVPSGADHPFRYTIGLTDLGTSFGVNGAGLAINASGVVAGALDLNATGPRRAFVTANGSLVDIGTLGGERSAAYAINDAGDVVGFAEIANGLEHPFLYRKGQMTDLGTLTGPAGVALGINNAGQIVGTFLTASGPPHAFVYTNGAAADLNDLLVGSPGLTLAEARGINEDGFIVGASFDSLGATRAFLLTPTGPPISRLFNLSVRASLIAGRPLIVGFVAEGGAKPVAVRAVGPGLRPFLPENANVAPDPRLELYHDDVFAQGNDNWGGDPALVEAFDRAGAFPLPPDSLDAALLRSVEGAHTAHASDAAGGIGLVEVYDGGAGLDVRLVNVSARYRVGSGDEILILGFTIEGPGPKTVLLRGVGPSLADFGVSDPLRDPKLEIYNAVGEKIFENDDWGGELATVFAEVGAFELLPGSKDSALVARLPPGPYTAQLSGVLAEATGEGLIEAYDLDR